MSKQWTNRLLKLQFLFLKVNAKFILLLGTMLALVERWCVLQLFIFYLLFVLVRYAFRIWRMSVVEMTLLLLALHLRRTASCCSPLQRYVPSRLKRRFIKVNPEVFIECFFALNPFFYRSSTWWIWGFLRVFKLSETALIDTGMCSHVNVRKITNS